MAISAVLRILISFVVLALLAGWSNHAAEQRQRAELVAAQKQANEATGKVAAWEGPSEPMPDMLGGPEKQYDALAATDSELPGRESTDRYLTAVAVAESLDPRVAASAAAALLTPTLLWEGDGITGKVDGATLAGYTWLDSQASTRATASGAQLSYHANVLGGHAVVRDASGTGNNQWWVSDTQMPDTLLTGTRDYTIIVLAKPAVVTGNTGFVATWGTQSSQWYCDPTHARIADTGGALAEHADGDLTDAFSIYVYSRNDDVIEISYGELAPGPNLSSLVTSHRPGDLGVENGQPRRMNFMHSAGGFKGDLAEIIFYDSHLSSRQLAAVEAYLDAKYCGDGSPGGPANPHLQKEFFVASNGKDTDPGTESRPFRTIQRAADLMRPGNTCTIRDGIYPETVRPPRSGIRGKPIRFRAYPGEEPRVHGTDLVRGWRHHDGAIFKMELGWETEQVFVDGRMMIEARWPNTGPDLMHPTLARTDANTTATKLVDAALTQADGYWDGAKVWIRPGGGWRGDNSTVTGYVKGELNITPNSMASTFGNVELFKKYAFPSPGNSYYVTRGPLSSLDVPGEWWLDRETFTLYIWLPGNEDPNNHRVQAKRRTNAFDLTGLSYIQVSGLRIFGATITMADAIHCQIDQCHLRYVSHVVDIEHKVGYEAHGHDTGLIVGGSENVVRSCSIVYSAGNGVVLLPQSSNCQVTNCMIHEINYANVDCAAIHAIGTGHLIRRNSLYNTGDAVLYARGNLKNSRIEYNDMHHGGMFSSDVGIIYAIGDGQGTVIANNWVHENLSSLHGPGIYLDSGAENYRVHHNVVWDMNPNSCAIVLSAPNSNNLLANNTTYHCGRGIDGGGSVEDWVMKGTRVINNIFPDSMWKIAPVPGKAGSEAVSQSNLQDLPAGNAGYVEWLNEYSTMYWPEGDSFQLVPDSLCVDAGAVISGITDGYIGVAPDIGAYEYGTPPWTAGCDLAGEIDWADTLR